MRNRSRKRGLRQEQGDVRVLHHQCQPLGRVVGIERQVGSSRLEYPEQPDHHVGRSIDAQADEYFRTDSARDQVSRS